jgi:hypothetical protein
MKVKIRQPPLPKVATKSIEQQKSEWVDGWQSAG